MVHKVKPQTFLQGLVALTLIVVGVGLLYYRLSLDTQNQLSHTDLVNQAEEGIWTLKLPLGQVPSSRNLFEPQMIYAEKVKYTTSVYKENLLDGVREVILQFREENFASNSGNYWSGLDPAMSLSPDKKSIAFIDNRGLHIYDLQNRKTITQIRKTREAKGDNDLDWTPPLWSRRELINTALLANPQWSMDGEYISVQQAFSEGGGMVFLNQIDNTLLVPTESGSSDIVWGPTQHQYLRATAGGYDRFGLYLSVPNDVTRVRKLIFPESGDESLAVHSARFSYDAQKVVFTFTPEMESDYKKLASINSDGSGFRLIAEETDILSPLFSVDGNTVYYFHWDLGNLVLSSYDLAKMEAEKIAVFPKDIKHLESIDWTEDGYLVVQAVVAKDDSGDPNLSSRFLILDLQNKDLIYASEEKSFFAKVAGFLK